MIETQQRSGFNVLSHSRYTGGRRAEDLLIISHGAQVSPQGVPGQPVNLSLYFNPAVRLHYYSPDRYDLNIYTFRVAAGDESLTPVEIIQPGERARDYVLPPFDTRTPCCGQPIRPLQTYGMLYAMAALRAAQGMMAADIALPVLDTLRLSDLLRDLPRPYARVHCLFCRPGLDGRYVGSCTHHGYRRNPAWPGF